LTSVPHRRPARWIAAKFGVHVTGVDLTPEFCAAAEALTRATGLTDRVRLINGSALELPVPTVRSTGPIRKTSS